MAALLLAESAGPAAARANGFGQACMVSFGMDDFSFTPVGLLELTIDYPTQTVRMVGSGAEVSCQSLIEQEHDASFDDDDAAGRLAALITSAAGFPTFTPVALCEVRASGVPAEEDFQITVLRELDTGGAPISPPVPVELLAIDCESVATTTSTTSTTTTTSTVPAASACSRPVSPSGQPKATDCLFILRAAVGLEACAPECICQPSGEAPTSATDALICLNAAVGGAVVLACPC